jgi:hypothetical protein
MPDKKREPDKFGVSFKWPTVEDLQKMTLEEHIAKTMKPIVLPNKKRKAK